MCDHKPPTYTFEEIQQQLILYIKCEEAMNQERLAVIGEAVIFKGATSQDVKDAVERATNRQKEIDLARACIPLLADVLALQRFR